ncbi:nucleoside 2-deoxyribosyltransferase [Ureaplasma miroungigenitalium]|uniref:Nucleoside 2-deoxyribosyltransferase n=1 Tax=Ureaplasma miroungigenitalium TaxID=1042321 RepID=A0ABT3BMU4_9BACT|nr:nucleoside 2-deoxyribosyltransferase [Ureaplasma miroungigenitalium]MCV3728570.1 nucleoside 2-deoxyribosyltransferase [Ureaplasma miroungigenitalium]
MARIYFANALFSEAELDFNKKVVAAIREQTKYSVYLPQENFAINDKTQCADSLKIYEADRNELDQCDLLVAVLDGLTIDNGVCTEIGYFAALKKPIIGLYTDSRRMYNWNDEQAKTQLLMQPCESQYAYVNLFVVGAIKANGSIATNIPELIQKINAHKHD